MGGGGIAKTLTAQEKKRPPLAEVVDTLNVDLPKMVDAETRLDKVTADPGHLVYWHTFTKVARDQIALADFYATMRPALTKRACENAPTRSALEQGISLIYVYASSDTMRVGSIGVSRSDCAS